MDKRHINFLIFAVIIFILSIFIFFPCLKAGFILDAHYVVEQNTLIKHPELYRENLSRNIFFAFRSSKNFNLNYYRPLVTLSYILDYKLWRLNATGYRITNIIIHIFSCFLIFYLIYLLSNDTGLAMLASFFFCLLPIHEWVVNYIVGRGDLLQCFFSLISLIFITKYIRKQHVVYLFISLSSFLFALLSREVAIILPLYVGLICLVLSEDKKRTFEITIYFLSISLAYFFIRHCLFPVAGNTQGHTNIIDWASKTIEYIPRLLVPWSIFYLVPFELKFLISFAITILLFVIMLLSFTGAKERPNKQKIFLGGFWMLFGTIPFVITGDLTDRLGPYLSEHFLYFPSIGFTLLLSLWILGIKKKPLRNTFIIFLSLFYLSINAYNAFFWKNEKALLKKVQGTEYNPFSVVSRQLLIRYEPDVEKIKRMISYEKENDKKSIWYTRLSQIYRSQNKYDLAFDYIKKSMECNPEDPNAYNTLAILYFETGNTTSGFKNLFRSLEIDNNYSETYRLLGTAFYFQRNFPEAATFLEVAYYFDPDNYETILYLSKAKESLMQ